MDVTNLSSRADQVAKQPSADSASSPAETAAGGDSGGRGSAVNGAGREEPVVNPVIALDTETNSVVLKFQEANGEVFMLPSRTALQYQQHQKDGAPEDMSKAAGE